MANSKTFSTKNKYIALLAIILVVLSFIYLKILLQPVAIVIPHHNLVRKDRQSFLKVISQRRLLTRHIVIISPDHFSPNQSSITSSKRSWTLSTGLATYNNFLELELPQNNSLLQDDHGLYNPLADLKTYFPNADYFPILLGQRTTPQQLSIVLAKLVTHCRWDCLLVSSVDFSHYLPATLAEVHDAFTISNLSNQDLQKLLLSEVDSPQALYLLSSFSSQKNAAKWTLFAHTNSGKISGDPDVETTTHVIGSYSFGRSIKNTDITLVHLPFALDRSQNQNTLGDRFFYGVDKFIIDSYIPNFVISQVDKPDKTFKYFLPIEKNSFVRGGLKRQLIKQYFDTISDQNVVKDYFWGTLIYERKSKTPVN